MTMTHRIIEAREVLAADIDAAIQQARDPLLSALREIADDGIENSRDPRTLIAKRAIAAVKGKSHGQ